MNTGSTINTYDLPPSGEPTFYAGRPELVMGLVGPLGTPLSDVYESLRQVLATFGYQTRHIRLSTLLEAVTAPPTGPSQDEYERISQFMKVGTELRRNTGHGDILARLAIRQVWKEREEILGEHFAGPSGPAHPIAAPAVAYVLNSLKNPEEVDLLRRVYGDGFILLSAYAPKEDRKQTLADRLSTSSDTSNDPAQTLADRLINRDHSEEGGGDFGQRVSEVFALSDLIVDTREKNKCGAALSRFFNSFFGYPFNSPTVDEFGAYQAYCASFRSLDLSRQVGAAILGEDGSVLGLGHNDAPKSGGGLYWEGDYPDGRDFSIGIDHNVSHRKRIIEEIVKGLNENGIIDKSWSSDPTALVDYLHQGKGKQFWSNFLVDNLLEFGRPLHAEMAAILDCTRKGIPLAGATLYCTTFPCHLCARLIIGSGIKRVVYVEPYEKSKTALLYRESVEVDPSSEVPSKVNFTPFVGIAPQVFEKLFSWKGKRRDQDGKPISWAPNDKKPIIKRYFNTYIMIEAAAIESCNHILKQSNYDWPSWETENNGYA